MVVLVARGGEYLMPGGGTTLAAGDTLLIWADGEALSQVNALVGVAGDLWEDMPDRANLAQVTPVLRLAPSGSSDGEGSSACIEDARRV